MRKAIDFSYRLPPFLNFGTSICPLFRTLPHGPTGVHNREAIPLYMYTCTYSDGVLADESLQTAGAVADGKGGAVLHIGAGLAAVVAMVSACTGGINRVFSY